MLAKLLLFSATSLNAAPMGTWQGSFDIVGQNDKPIHAQAILFIGRNGQEPIGGLGENEKDLGALQDLKVGTDTVSFELRKDNAIDLKFGLELKSDHLIGSGTGQMRGETVRIDADFSKAPTVHTLFEQISNMDSQLFEGFNERDISPFKTFFAKDLEFYHDKSGFSDYAGNIKVLGEKLAEKDHYRRQLDPATLEVYEVKDFGAMEIGVHRFYTTSPGQPERLTAIAKFAHVWRFKNGKWELSRALSYDHH